MINLSTPCTYRGKPAIIVSRCFVGREWLYGVRLVRSNKIINYVPGRMLTL